MISPRKIQKTRILRSDPVELTRELVARKSFGGANEPFSYLKDILENKGAEVRVIESNGIKNIHASIGEGEAELGFNGHYDTVPPGNGWQTDPLEPIIKNGMLYGLGSCDMKGGLATMLAAYLELAEMELPSKIIFQAVGDEEIGGENGSKTLVEKGLYAKRMIIGEPGGNEITYGHKSVMHVELKTFGRNAHSSTLYDGQNAVLKAIRILGRIKKDRVLRTTVTKNEAQEATTCNIGYIKGGGPINVVPDECSMILDIRIPADKEMKDIYEYLKRVSGQESQVRILIQNRGMYTQPTHEMISVAKRILEEEYLEKTVSIMACGASDGRYFTYKGVPTISMGPAGFDKNGNKKLHKADEFVPVDELIRWKEIYKRMALYYAEKKSGR